MKLTAAYAARRAIIAELQTMTAAGGALYGVQVAKVWRGGQAEAVCVYGGRIRFEQTGDTDVYGSDSAPLTVDDVAVVELHVRARLSPTPADGPDASDGRAEEIGDAVAGAIRGAPATVAGPGRVARIAGGEGDYMEDDDAATSLMTIRVEVRSTLEARRL